MSDEGDVDKAAVKLVEEDEAAGKTEKIYEDWYRNIDPTVQLTGITEAKTRRKRAK